MSQWVYRSGSYVSAGNGAGDALSIAKPTGTASGDLLIFVAYWETDTNTVSASDSVASARRQANTGAFMIETFYKIAGGSEPATYTFTPSTNGQWRSIAAAAYQSGTGSGPWEDVEDGAQGDTTAEASQTAPSVTTTGVNRLVVFGYGNLFGTDPTGMNGFCSNRRGSIGGCTIADAAKAAAGATGTSNPTAQGTQTYAAQHVAFISDTGEAITRLPAVGPLVLAGIAPVLARALFPAVDALVLTGQALVLDQAMHPSAGPLLVTGLTPTRTIAEGVTNTARIHIRPVGFA